MVNGSDASFVFGDNFLIVNLTVMPYGKPQCHSHILNYHCTREARAKAIIKFVHIHGNGNPADIVTKSRASKIWSPYINPLLFWLHMDFLK